MSLPVFGQNLHDKIAESHIKANVPAANKFNEFLRRDLEKHFEKEIGTDAKLYYEMLQERPTQSGVSYPKYYLWASIIRKDNIVTEGAVRVAATERLRFEVLQFLSRTDIERKNSIVFEIFPKAVAESILDRLRPPKAAAKKQFNIIPIAR